MLTYEGERFQGTQQILEKLTSLPFQRIKHRADTIDVQPSPGNGMVVFVTGQLLIDDEANPMKFSQTFNLQPTGQPGGFYVLNDLFRLNYG